MTTQQPFAHVEVPQFGALLGEFIAAVPPAALPALLSGLETEAAARYRHWAAQTSGDARSTLLACAGRELEIAEKVRRLFPVDDEDTLRAVDAAVERAKPVYVGAFESYSLAEQLHIQSEAELQGARAWRDLASQQASDSVTAELEACAALEVESSKAVKRLLEEGRLGA